MLKRTPNEYDRLVPYLEGTLDEAQRTQMESRLAADPALAAEADRLRRTMSGLRGSAARLGPAENSEVPALLWPRLQARLEEAPLPAPRQRGQSWWLAGVGATAAAGLAVAAFWLPGWHTPEVRTVSTAQPPVTAPRPANTTPTDNKAVSALPKGPMPAVLPPPTIVPTHPAALPAKKPTGTPTQVASVPRTTTGPEYSVTDPFALPSAPTYYAPSPKVSGSTVDEQRRFKVTGDVQTLNPALRKVEMPQKAQERDRQVATAYATPASQPTPSVPTPPMLNAPITPSAQGPQNQAFALNGTNAPGAFGGGALAGGTAQAQHGQAQTEQNAKVQDAPTSGVTKSNVTKMALRQPNASLFAQRAYKPAKRAGQNALGANTQQIFDGNTSDNLEGWQTALSAAVQSPLWGDNERVQQANQALMSAKMSGMLDDLRARLEARRTQSPQDLVNARMLASVYEYGFSGDAALRERRRITGLEGAVGEDWFALAQAEEKHGNSAAARAAYRHALESPTPPTPFHLGIARERS